MERSDIRAAWDVLALFVPPMLGAYIGLRYAVDQTPKAKVLSFASSAVLACYFGPAVSEYFVLRPSAASAVSIVMAAVGMEIVAGFIFIARQFAAAPLDIVRKAIDMLRGRNGA